MSNYGSSLYGLNYYGTPVTAGTAGGYYSSNFTAEHIDYRKIKLSWSNVSPLYSSEIIYAWKIVKTVGGAPDYPNSAPIVRSDTNLTSSTSYVVVGNSFTDVDTVFPAGVIVTYSLWILVGADTNTRNWLSVGSADAIIVENDNDTTYKLLSLLPNVWTSRSGDALGGPDIPKLATAAASFIKGAWSSGSNYSSDDIVTYGGNTYYCSVSINNSQSSPDLDSIHFTLDSSTDIYRFLKNFGFYYDKLRTEVKAISNISDYRVHPPKLLPYAVTSLGFSYEPSLGANYHRSLYRSGNIINSLKGTRLGLQKYVKALTNFNANITIGKNLLPGTADSSFEGDRGNWYSLGGYFQYKSRAVTGENQPTSAIALSLTNLTDGYGLLTKGLLIESLSPGATLLITTTDKHGLSTNGVVSITGVKPTVFNLSNQTITKISDTQFSIPVTVANRFTVGSFTNVAGSAYTTINLGSHVHGLVAGDTVTITGSANFNGTWSVLTNPAPVDDTAANSFAIPVKPASGWNTSQTGMGTSTINVSNAVVTSSAYSDPTIKSYGAERSTEETLAKLIPVSPGVPYLFSGWAKSLSTNAHTTNACTITAQINWYDARGNFLSNATAGTTVTLVKGSPGSWYKFESNTSYAAAYSPANAAYAGIYIATAGLISSTSTSDRDSIALDYLSFNVYPSLVASVNYGIGDFVYDDPRDVKITVRGARTNYINNPNFEEGISSWNVISPSSGTFVQDFTQTPPYSGGVAVAKFNDVGSVLYSDWVKNLTPATYYTFSIYVKSASTVGVKAAIEFNAPQKLSDQANASTDAVGPYFSPTPYKTISSTVSLTAGGDWTRISVTALSPEYLGANGLPSAVVSLEFTSTPSGNWWVDAAMLEESVTPGLYFQGNGGPPAATNELVSKDYIYPSDCAWETRLRTNFVPNPGFEGGLITNWYLSSGSGAIGTTTTYKKFGTYSGAVAYTSATSAVATTVRLPVRMANGSTYVFPNIGDVLSGSVYVYATVSGKFQLNVKSSDTSSLSYSELGNNPGSYVYAQTGNWVRLDKSIILNTSIYNNSYVTFEVKFIADSGTTGTWYLDGAQLEVGDIVSSHVDTSAGATYSPVTNNGAPSSVTAVSTPTPVTIYTNDFEVSTLTTMLGASFSSISLGNTPTVSRSDFTKSSGTYSMGITTNAGNVGGLVNCRLQGNAASNGSPPSVVRPNAYYTGGVKVRRAVGVAPSGFVIIINWLDSSYAAISSSTSSVLVITTAFQSISVVAQAPSNAAYAYLSIQYTSLFESNAAVYVDEAYLNLSGITQYTVGSTSGIVAEDIVAIQGISPSTYNSTGSSVVSVDDSTHVTVVNNGSGAATFTSATINTLGTSYATNSPMSGIGRSYYWPNKATKFSRLVKTIANYLPLGSTYTLKYGLPNTPVNETGGSVVTSSLFANGIYGWQAVAATSLSPLTSTSLSSTGAPTIARYIGAGALSQIASTYYGGAHTPNFISLTNTNNKAYFGIQQAKVSVDPGTAYKLSTALSYIAAGSSFTPQYVITWYDNANTEISTVTAIDTGSSTNYASSSGSRSTGSWGNFTKRMVSPNTAAYATISIVITPTSAAATNIMYLSRVVVAPDYSNTPV